MTEEQRDLMEEISAVADLYGVDPQDVADELDARDEVTGRLAMPHVGEEPASHELIQMAAQRAAKRRLGVTDEIPMEEPIEQSIVRVYGWLDKWSDVDHSVPEHRRRLVGKMEARAEMARDALRRAISAIAIFYDDETAQRAFNLIDAYHQQPREDWEAQADEGAAQDELESPERRR